MDQVMVWCREETIAITTVLTVLAFNSVASRFNNNLIHRGMDTMAANFTDEILKWIFPVKHTFSVD